MWMCTNLGESTFPRDFNTTLMFAIRFLNLMRHEHNDFASFVKLSFARRHSKLKNLAPICSCLHYTGSSLVLPLPDFECACICAFCFCLPSWLEAFLETLLVSKDNKLCQSGSSDWQSLLTQKFEIPNLKFPVIDCAFLILSQWQKTSFNRECPLLTTRKNSGLRHFSIGFFFQTPRRSPLLGPLRPEVVDHI